MKPLAAQIEQTEIIRLSLEGQRQIAEAILNPPKQPALRRAARRYRELFGVDDSCRVSF
jgi:uncharacterized protein (DUF1778 family)